MCFTFDSYLVAGFTPIRDGNGFDTPVYRPDGMRGYIINLTVSGKGCIKTSDGTFYCEQGDMLIFPPGVAHDYERSESDEYWEHYWIYFFPRPYWINWLKWEEMSDSVGFLSLGDSPVYNDVKNLFIETIEQFSQNNFLSEAMSMNALERILLTCLDVQRKSLNRLSDPRIEEICNYLDCNIESEYNIEELAAKVFLSPSRLSHLFKSETGKTINGWREYQRITRAKVLLQTSAMSISDLAVSIGYNDPFYFSKVFKRHCGLSPRDYKNNYLLTNELLEGRDKNRKS